MIEEMKMGREFLCVYHSDVNLYVLFLSYGLVTLMLPLFSIVFNRSFVL